MCRELEPGYGRYKKINIGRATTAAARHTTLESVLTVPSSTVAKIIKEISVDVPPLRPRRSKTVALRPGVDTRGAAGKHLPRHFYFFFPSRRCRIKYFSKFLILIKRIEWNFKCEIQCCISWNICGKLYGDSVT